MKTVTVTPLYICGSRPTEHESQSTVIQWAQLMEGQYPALKLLFAIPNGANKTMTTAMKFKREGLKAGVPDLCLPFPNGCYHGLFIEMKSEKGKETPAQRDFINALTKNIYRVAVCHSAQSP